VPASEIRNALIVQTAFLGDVILTLPLVQVLKRSFPSTGIDIVVTPQAAKLLQNHPALRAVLEFDKRGKDSGIGGLMSKVSQIRKGKYELAVVPHRSLRSALLVRLGNIPLRIGFHTSAGKILFNEVVRYEKSLHEVERNLRLLGPLGIEEKGAEYPELYPADDDRRAVNDFLKLAGIKDRTKLIAVAPGTVWNTKRWLKERFVELSRKLVEAGWGVVLIGGRSDVSLCDGIVHDISLPGVFSTAGELTLLQCAELIRRCQALVCNDSAPMHLAVAVRTPVVAVFGATVPEFGFAPYGKYDTVVETKGLACRPCSIHGGERCPISTFECMVKISADEVLRAVMQAVERARAAMRASS
jgi:heptosyltransferase-2